MKDQQHSRLTERKAHEQIDMDDLSTDKECAAILEVCDALQKLIDMPLHVQLRGE